MDPLLSIENRLEELQCKLGFSSDLKFNKSAVEGIADVENNLNKTIAARENISSLCKRLDELNNYLDPQYVNQMNDSKLKVHYLLTNEVALKNYCHSMLQSQEKSDVLDSTEIAKIPELTEEIQKIRDSFMDMKSQCDQVSHIMLNAMESYNTVSLRVMDQLAELNNRLDTLESTSKN